MSGHREILIFKDLGFDKKTISSFYTKFLLLDFPHPAKKKIQFLFCKKTASKNE